MRLGTHEASSVQSDVDLHEVEPGPEPAAFKHAISFEHATKTAYRQTESSALHLLRSRANQRRAQHEKCAKHILLNQKGWGESQRIVFLQLRRRCKLGALRVEKEQVLALLREARADP